MKNKMLTIVGVLALALAIGLNVRHALNDYGVKDGKLHVEVLAQASGSGGGSTSGGGSGSGSGSTSDDSTNPYSKGYLNNPEDCTITKSFQCSIGITIPDWVPYVGGTKCESTWTQTKDFKGTRNYCTYTGNKETTCSYHECKENGT